MSPLMPINEVLTATLCDLGQPAPNYILQTLLLKDGHFIGHKYRYDGGYAVLQAGGNAIQFFDDDGKPLTNVAIDADKGAAA